MRHRANLVAAIAVVMLAACAGVPVDGSKALIARIDPLAGSAVSGEAQFTESTAGVLMTVRAEGLPRGRHAFHIHEAGDCRVAVQEGAPRFEPPERPGEKRVGELYVRKVPPLVAGDDGTAFMRALVWGYTLRGSVAGIIGRAAVVHAGIDDPYGSAGPAVACGVIGAAAR